MEAPFLPAVSKGLFACLVFGPGSIRVRRGVARMPVAVAAMAAGAAALFTTRTATFRRSRSGLAPEQPRSGADQPAVLVAGACEMAACVLFRIASSRCLRASAASPPAVAW